MALWVRVPLSLTMAIKEDCILELTCNIEADQYTFLVTLHHTAVVDELRCGVYQQVQLAALRLRVLEVDLWKVCPGFHIICQLSGRCSGPLALSLAGKYSQYDEIRNVSCCSCIVISLAGPYLRISGTIFVEVFTVQTFTGYIYLGGNPFEME